MVSWTGLLLNLGDLRQTTQEPRHNTRRDRKGQRTQRNNRSQSRAPDVWVRSWQARGHTGEGGGRQPPKRLLQPLPSQELGTTSTTKLQCYIPSPRDGVGPHNAKTQQEPSPHKPWRHSSCAGFPTRWGCKTSCTYCKFRPATFQNVLSEEVKDTYLLTQTHMNSSAFQVKNNPF